MRTIILQSNGFTLETFLIDNDTKIILDDVVRIEFGALDVDKCEPWAAKLFFGEWTNKAPEEVFIQTKEE